MEKEVAEIISKNIEKVRQQCITENELIVGNNTFYEVKLSRDKYYCTYELEFDESTIKVLLKKFKFREIIFLKNFE